MHRKIKLDSLRGDLASIIKLLSMAHDVGDPVGEIQYKSRIRAIESEIAELENIPTNSASVSLFFGGGPVVGSRGIAAGFAGLALEKFQDLVTRTYAKAEYGVLGRRGPVPLKAATRLMVTETARGSFGFVLNEMNDQVEIDKTPLSYIVNEVDQVVQDVASLDDSHFEAAIERLDARTLTGLRDFFIALDSSDASLRIVDDQRDVTLDRSAVTRGRMRTEATRIDEEQTNEGGELLGFLPQHRKFEMRTDSGEMIYGGVSKAAAEQFQAFVHSGVEPIGRRWNVSIVVRTVASVRRAPRQTYFLSEFLVGPSSAA